tara:strand:- start:448 stop:603 length:156 start_codon:yes stop_codon:yes gene_type:complete
MTRFGYYSVSEIVTTGSSGHIRQLFPESIPAPKAELTSKETLILGAISEVV